VENVDQETILIIDDEAGAQQTIRRMLEYYNIKSSKAKVALPV
jgi:hypothetical protein